MARLFDMAKMTVSGTPSTGTITLGSAVSGFQTFDDAGVTNGLTISYSIKDGALWEVGRGVYTTSGTTLTRGSLFSSSGGAAVNLTSAAIVWISTLCEDLIQVVTLVGNIDGTATPIISPELAFAGGNNITLSGTSNTISIIGAATVAQSVQTLGFFAVGNTTGTTSSETRDARTISFDGAGIASVGFSAGSIIISASTAATNPLLSIFAVGNTTSSVSSGLNQAGSLSFDGAGLISIGVSSSSIVVSGPTTVGAYAVGNTTAQTSSIASHPFLTGNSSNQISGAGIVSVGFSTVSASDTDGTTTTTYEIISASSRGSLSLYAVGNTTISSSTSSVLPEALSFSGTGGISVGYSSNTIIISGATVDNDIQSLFAVGNTTDSTSSGAAGIGSLSFDGAGLVSIGISDSSIIVSGPTTVGGYAVGN